MPFVTSRRGDDDGSSATAKADSLSSNDDDAPDSTTSPPRSSSSHLSTISLDEVRASRAVAITLLARLEAEDTDVVPTDVGSKHRILITHDDVVYDIGEFIKNHPGGARRILRAAGGAVEPFWKMYAQHSAPGVRAVLDELAVGRLSTSDVAKLQEELAQELESDPFANDPKRGNVEEKLLVHSYKPFNAEARAESLLLQQHDIDDDPASHRLAFVTPNDAVYVRHHLPVPVGGGPTSIAVGECRFDVADLMDESKFRRHRVKAVLQCSGNRRSEAQREARELELPDPQGLPWKQGAIANVEWEGVLLADVLRAAGVVPEKKMVTTNDGYERHVQFAGADVPRVGDWKDETGFYGASIPLRHALDVNREVLVAFRMNGEPLSMEHGYPLRIIVPGCTGARWVKWVERIEVADDESPSFWQQNDYRILPGSVRTRADADFSAMPALNGTPVSSAIIWPPEGATVSPSEDGTVEVSGWAHAGSGRGIAYVEVSIGSNGVWHQAEEVRRDADQDMRGGSFSWTTWRTRVPLPAAPSKGGEGEIVLRVRARDVDGNVQPDANGACWNLRGLCFNGVHARRCNAAAP